MDNLDNRTCGILLPIFSLPSDCGIGTLGRPAYHFIDFLQKSGQTYWQILPVHPTFRDNSSYTAFSAFAGNELFIDLDLLIKDKFLKKSDIQNLDFGANPSRVDYKKLTATRQGIYKKLFLNFTKNIPMDFQQFCQDEQFWLDDYALFMSIFDYLDGAELLD